MYNFLAVLLVAALCFQGSAAASNADAIHDTYLKSLTQYLGTLQNTVVTEWPAFSAHELRTTDLAYGLNNLGFQLKNTYMTGSCVTQLRADYTDMKNQAISAYQKCAGSMSPSLDQEEISNAIDQLKSLDDTIQQIGHECDNIRNIWAKRGCIMGHNARITSIYMKARFQEALKVYNDALDSMQEKGQDLIDCISQATTGMPERIQGLLQKLYNCSNDK